MNKDMINSINNAIGNLIPSTIGLLYRDDEKNNSHLFNLTHHKIVNFVSSSYLGLEYDKRLIDGAIDAIKYFGSQFSVSGDYFSKKMTSDLEEQLSLLFNASCIVFPNTSSAQNSTLKNIINKDDLVLIDEQVNSSIQLSIRLLQKQGNKIEFIRHNRIDNLEDKIIELRKKHHKIWYFADSIYSTNGNKAPLNSIYSLLNKYKELHLFIDDSHGISCYGLKGSGLVLGNQKLHPKIIVTSSLNKAFAAGGSAVFFSNKELEQKVRLSDSFKRNKSYMQVSSLGAALACIKIHLSKDIINLQKDLQENIKYTNKIFQKLELPLYSNNDSPIFFLCANSPKSAYSLVNRLLKDGFYTNIGIFPETTSKIFGLRFTISKLHSFEQIECFAMALKFHFNQIISEEGFNSEVVYHDFSKKELKKKEENKTGLDTYYFRKAPFDSKFDEIYRTQNYFLLNNSFKVTQMKKERLSEKITKNEFHDFNLNSRLKLIKKDGTLVKTKLAASKIYSYYLLNGFYAEVVFDENKKDITEVNVYNHLNFSSFFNSSLFDNR